MVWQLMQVRKLYDSPVLLVGKMWAELLHWARTHMVDSGHNLADPVDMTIPQCVEVWMRRWRSSGSSMNVDPARVNI